MSGRELNNRERFLINSVLPSNKKGYLEFKQKISEFVVLKEDEFFEGNLLLGKRGADASGFSESAPTFALGYSAYGGNAYFVTIGEERDGFVEVNLREDKETDSNGLIWSYSEWRPGYKAPEDSSAVREVHLIKHKLVVAIAPQSRKIWVYEAESGVNYILPVANFYNEIMRVKEEKNPEIVLNPQRIFDYPDELTDEEIGQGFLTYNEYVGKLEIDYGLFKKNENEGRHLFFRKIFGKQNA